MNTTQTSLQGPPVVVSLESPTSISMKNSLIMKTTDTNFEAYYRQMVRRKIAMALTNSLHSKGSNSAGVTEINSPRGSLCFVKGKRPPARDGHAALISGNHFIIFGGDRHLMPFNDLFILDLASEFSLKKGMFI